MSALQPVTPPALERVVRRCLAKNPDDRWQTARDLGWELKSIAEEGAHAAKLVRERKRRAMLMGALIGAGLVAAVSVAAWILRPGDTSPPSYQRLTFRRGIISSARFAPDGQTVIFSAAWDARPYELFLARIGSTESRSLGMANGRILSVSSTGEMAVLLGPQSFFGGIGTLARASLAGGLPREVLEGVTEADWGPDGALAVVKRRENRMELEFPVGTKLHEATSIWSMRVSPAGDALRSSSRPRRQQVQCRRGGRRGPIPEEDHAGEGIDGPRTRLVSSRRRSVVQRRSVRRPADDSRRVALRQGADRGARTRSVEAR